MEDEEGYTALSFRPKVRTAEHSRQPETQGSPRCSRWHRIAVGAGWAWIIILTVVVIALAIQVSQLQGCCEEQGRGDLNTSEKIETGIINRTEGSSSLEDFRSHLKSILCEPRNGSLAGGAGCKLCPVEWLLRGDKCYWLSEEQERKDWTGSRDDCWGKRSRLLVLQSQEELDSLQVVTQGASSVWIGLKVIPPRGNWTWVDGSWLDPARFPVSGSADGNSCGRIRGSRIHSETCDAALKWICQKEAAVI